MTIFMIDDDGWLNRTQRVDSPNCDERPLGVAIDLLVIHGISLPPGQYGGPWIDALFTNTLPGAAHPYFLPLEGVRVSAHLLIRRDGTPVQYVSFPRRAWHAGVSTWAGRPRCNDYSIGIELEGADHDPYTDIQYAVLTDILRTLISIYPAITPDRIVGHCDIAPGRKTDPGPAFDWARLRHELYEPNG
ncbi:1,6-anhydro-N-acetylmuramoyl-L-alanine amidase [Gammaproteobacteria bacterium]